MSKNRMACVSYKKTLSVRIYVFHIVLKTCECVSLSPRKSASTVSRPMHIPPNAAAAGMYLEKRVGNSKKKGCEREKLECFYVEGRKK